ncbi:MAG: LamG domain-containing protein, partial [Chitinophagia bacterium]|nr:LamG domain-containing protein [Chitinophagia bacterium]
KTLISRDVLNLTDSGNVGINIDTPQSLLHLHNTAASGEVRLSLTDGNSGTTTTDGFAIIKDINENCSIWNYENTSLSFATSNIERFIITSNGNINYNININPPNSTDYNIIDIEPTVWYKFDNSANIGEDSKNNANFTSVGSVTYNTSIVMKGSGSAFFNGSSYLTGTGVNLDSKSFSISFWIYNTNYSNHTPIYTSKRISPYVASKKCILIYINYSQLKLQVSFNDGAVAESTTVANDLNSWIHYCIVYNNANYNIQIYKNGVINSTTITTSTNFISPSTDYFIGTEISNQTNLGYLNNAYLDDLRIYSGTALSSTQVFNLYNLNTLIIIPSFNLNTNYTSNIKL